MRVRWINEGVCFPEGFLSSGVHCGIKEKDKDLGLIFCPQECWVAATFTTNKVKAAPVVVSAKKIAQNPTAKAIVVNSGNANCCTGQKGLNDAKEMCYLAAKELGIKEEEVLVCSTGVIGALLPMDRVREGIARAVKQLEREDLNFSKAILTTDTHTKRIAVEVEENGFTFRIGGCAKGAGMIYPNMATMLAFITTDVEIPRTELQAMLSKAVKESFNRISVDGDMSTNDTVILLSRKGKQLPKELIPIFQDVLTRVCESLALMIVRDGEGATKVVKVTVKGAKTEEDAEKACRKIVNSLLFKTALYGEDPNWGRIMGAVGASEAEITPEKIDIYFEDVKVVSCGMAVDPDAEKEATKVMQRDSFEVVIDLKMGDAQYHMFTCDLTYDYVRINAEYRS